jgi:PEP-CTERM motif
MRRLFAALVLSLALSAAAHADSFQYTLIWDFPHIAAVDTSAYVGTYTFTVNSLLTGNTFVYGNVSPYPQFPGYPYIYAADFTVPTNSNANDPNKFFADYGDGSGSFASMQITELSTSPVPEPSTITLFGFGALALLAGIYLRVGRGAYTSNPTHTSSAPSMQSHRA